jgi:hypothetical protein
LDEPLCETWLFLSDASPWPASPDIACFPGFLDDVRLADQLLAWYWVRGLALPAQFSSSRLELMNGLVSVRVGPEEEMDPAASCLYGMHVVSYGACGGDLALRLSRNGSDLFVLADALGKGEKAAQDVAIFAEGVITHLKKQPLNGSAVSALSSYMQARLSFPRFVAAMIIEFDWKLNRACLLNAGMPPLLTYSHGKPIKEFAAAGPPFGVPGMLASCREVPLPESAVWLLTSDGVAEDIRLSSLGRLAENLEHSMTSLISPSFHMAFSWNTVRPPAGLDDASLILIQTRSPGR